jgi:hypothetical protein
MALTTQAMEQAHRPVFRTKQQLAHDLTKCYFTDRRNPRLVDRMLEHTHGSEGALLPKPLREGRLDFWRDAVPPFVVDDIQQTALGPDLYTLTYQVGLNYSTERSWGWPHRVTCTYDNKVKAQALARIPRKYPQKGFKLHVLDWGMPRVNGYGEPESLMDFTAKAEASVLTPSITASSGNVATDARVATMQKRSKNLLATSKSDTSLGGGTMDATGLSFDAQSPDLTVGLSPNMHERVRAEMMGTLNHRNWSVKPSLDMQLQMAKKDHSEAGDDEDRYLSTSSSLPSLGTACVYDKGWNTVVGWGSHRQKALQLSHGNRQPTDQQRPRKRQTQGLRTLYPFVYA